MRVNVSVRFSVANSVMLCEVCGVPLTVALDIGGSGVLQEPLHLVWAEEAGEHAHTGILVLGSPVELVIQVGEQARLRRLLLHTDHVRGLILFSRRRDR